jgi:hydrogenase maturation protease
LNKILILGIGNLLMGDEGIGVHAIRYLENNEQFTQVDLVDGGTGGFHLLEYFQKYLQIIMIDATIDGQPPGTIQLLKPKFSSDYPPTLTAHDIGLKDLLDALYLLKQQPEIWLYTVSIARFDRLSIELSPELETILSVLAKEIRELLETLTSV